METVTPYWEAFTSWLLALEPTYLMAGGGGLVLLIGLLVALRVNRRGGGRQASPQLQVASFQLAPLGRDAFLKITNQGEKAVLSSGKIIGRNDVLIKNTLAGHEISRDGSYSLLLEAVGNERLQANFAVELTFVDEHRRGFQQTFFLNPLGVSKPKKTTLRT